ncbi:suppressor of cytokine signaling 7-like isoform X2 [Nelusetta ayraudi]|uniref:suppressor of cytokine signaling 7-like isoform X2 n=1 Tax=Nelusetta ayraudi TaxID=303726 RepID=UPI003F72737D
MNDAQQEVSPDFVLMRLVSAAEYHRLDKPDQLRSGGGGFGPVKPVLLLGGSFHPDSGGPSAALGSASPHYSSPLPGRGELDAGSPPSSEPPEEFAVAAQRFVDFPVQNGSRAQLMVFQNRILEPPPGFLQEEQLESGPSICPGPGPGGGKEPAEENLLPPALLQWHPVRTFSKGMDRSQNLEQGILDSESGSGLCPPHRLLTDQLAKWPPGLLDQALRLGLVQEPRKNRPTGVDQSVVVLAQRLGQLGEGAEGGRTAPPSCSCHGVPGGEDPGDTSDALLVLEGLGSEEEGCKGGVVGGAPEGAEPPVFSSGTLSGLMQQVHQLAEEAGVCTQQGCRARRPTAPPAGPAPLPSSASSAPSPRPQSRSQPQSRAATPGPCPSPTPRGEGQGGGPRGGKSRKGGSLKVRLSKLFRTRSSGGGPGGLLDKRPSLASSTSSGGSLLDVWGSTCSSSTDNTSRLQVSRPHSAFSPVPFTPAFTGETVSLVDVDVSRRGVGSLHPPTPPPPPRRSLSLLDDFGPAPPQRSGGASMQSLPPRPLALTPPFSTIQHSLSLNDSSFLRGLPRPLPLRPGAQQPPLRCSFSSSLRELEKCGWYWGPMNWEDAEMKLKGAADGSFLVRDSSDPRYILSLSFRSQGVTHHTRMEHYRGTFSLWCHPRFEDRCHSVVEFIERAIVHSKNGKFLYFLRSRVPGLPPTPVQLLYPVSRFSSVKSLQHLCRFCIRQLVRIDHIQELPLPRPLISYLRKFYYYDPEEEVHPSLKDPSSSQQGAPHTETVQPLT